MATSFFYFKIARMFMEEVAMVADKAEYGWAGFHDTPHPKELALEHLDRISRKRTNCKVSKPKLYLPPSSLHPF